MSALAVKVSKFQDVWTSRPIKNRREIDSICPGGVRHDPRRFMGKTVSASFQSWHGRVRIS